MVKIRELYRFASKIHEGKPKIFLAMPNQGNICPKNVMNLIGWFMAEEYTLQFCGPDDKRPHDRARNFCAKAFMRTDFEYLLYMDAQTAPEPSYLDRLLKADKPVVSGVVQTIQAGSNKLPYVGPQVSMAPLFIGLTFRESDGKYRYCDGKGLTEVDAASCAFMLIKREVIEKVHEQFGPPFSWHRLTDEEWGIDGYAEDFDFCIKVKEAGFPIFAHFGCLCMHQQRADMRAFNQILLRVTQKERGKREAAEQALKQLKRGEKL